jgi:hypothetical protein
MADSVEQSSPLTWLADPFRPTSEDAEHRFRFTADKRVWLAPIAIGVALLVISGVGFLGDADQFYFSYLTGWTFCLSLSIGALFYLFFQHLTKAEWGVVVRRIAESLLWGFPILALLGIPILFGMHDLYHWTHAELYDPSSPQYDEILAGKRAYLNTPFWLVRMGLYFVVWTFLAYKLYGLSVEQDQTGAPDIPSRLRTVSAVGLPLTAVTTAFASYDLLMSLDPHWFSTIFGVYLFGGAYLAVVAFIALVAMVMQRRGGLLTDVVSSEHYHDLGKYTFGFVVFWAYIAFSQYMLIWYAGIPEETLWYEHRLAGGWGWHSAALVLLHFVVPFVVLLPRFTKRAVPIFGTMAVWVLGMHWFDYHWIVQPVLNEQAGFHWLDFTCWIGLLCLFVGFVMFRLQRHSLVPRQDPRLADSLRFQNV